MLLLSIESTCDETAAAVIDDQLVVRGSAVASQDELHQRFKGVVPEIAARAHVERILPTIDQALQRASVTLRDIDLFAVANTPGLAGSLMVGLVAAKSLAWAYGKPLVAINHLHAHVYACCLAAKRSLFPCVGFVVSGGHTTLFDCRGPCEFVHLGGTIDDAAGEAFDKVATMLGLGYPGGPHISRVAAQGNPAAFRFPRSFANDPSTLDFSFSGLKTAVRYAIAGPGKPLPNEALPATLVADLAASFQLAVVESLVAKAKHALQRTKLKTLCVGGGVAANHLLRERLREMTDQLRCELWIAPPELCTDNAVMGAIAFERFRLGKVEPLDLDAIAGLVRGMAPGESLAG